MDIHLQPTEGAFFCPEQNTDNPRTPRTEHDATGVFQPCAFRAARLYGLPRSSVTLVNLHTEITDKARRYRARFEQLIAALHALVLLQVRLRFLALACHGWLDGTQLVPGAYLAEFIALLAQLAHQQGIVIALWACSTADAPDGVEVPAPGGARGFAFKLWQGLKTAGVRTNVLGHPTAGHALQNPRDVLFWDGDDVSDGVGDIYVRWPRAFGPTDPGDPLFPEFDGLMHHTMLPYELPFMTPADAHARVALAARGGGVGRTGDVNPRAFGMRNLEVALVLLGYDPGRVDGIRDPRTTLAIQQFQRANRDPNGAQLDDDGRVGKLTGAALLSALRARGVADSRVFQQHAGAVE